MLAQRYRAYNGEFVSAAMPAPMARPLYLQHVAFACDHFVQYRIHEKAKQ
jgi:hypothetical protein